MYMYVYIYKCIYMMLQVSSSVANPGGVHHGFHGTPLENQKNIEKLKCNNNNASCNDV